jgi:hypothetical protein
METQKDARRAENYSEGCGDGQKEMLKQRKAIEAEV